MMAKANRISVVVLCRNQSGNLRRILHSLSRQTLRPCEVVVADDDSTQPVEDIAERGGCRYVRTQSDPSPFAGRRALARQLGTLASKGNIILYLDGDILIPPRLLEGLEAQHGSRTGAAVVKVPRSYRITLDNKLIRNLPPPAPGAGGDELIPFDRFTSDCFSVERDSVMEVGGWDTAFVGWGEEDVELAYRFQLAGIPITPARSPMLYCTHLDHAVDRQRNFLSLRRNARYFAQKFKEVGIIRAHAWGAIETYCAAYYGPGGAPAGFKP